MLARQIGVGPSAVAQWELPGGTSPTLEHLASIARSCAVHFEWLATGRGDARAPLVKDTEPVRKVEPACAAGPTAAAAIDAVAWVETDAELLLLRCFRRLDPTRRQALLRFLDGARVRLRRMPCPGGSRQIALTGPASRPKTPAVRQPKGKDHERT
jgi:transcriptional regulator with XRE-family HTH domain